MVGPTSSTSISVSAGAPAIASTEPKAPASARAAVGPTCLIDRATSTRHSGRLRASSRFLSRLVALAVSSPPIVTKNGDCLSLSAVSVKRSPSSATRRASRSADAAS